LETRRETAKLKKFATGGMIKAFGEAIRNKLQSYLPFGSTLLKRKGTVKSSNSPNRKTKSVRSATPSLSINLMRSGTQEESSKDSISIRPLFALSGELSLYHPQKSPKKDIKS
jgi:hypothetical protein